ncbi:3-mercaptopyruvate sulfurtransferase [Sphingomonas sp.]|uniref:3-mercaptopyruvate sulfurtransferase n=1 Tax=Sphingomonas sp. TaxID=28214 RepID=UPI0025DE99E2|nr:3-mercaptopyruvate sulfurtransferase [Sphingomonas sp.]
MDALVSTEWLATELGASDLRIVDASWHLDERDPAAEYEAGHIPGAVFMDLAAVADTSTELPMMLPKAEKFASRMQSLGLGDGSRIVIYDDSALHTSARAWWMLNLFGAHDVAILDGGLAKWKAEGRDLATGKEQLRHRHFTVWKDEAHVRDKSQMAALSESKAEQIVDARSAARFEGREAEPRLGVHPGHIPGSRNLPMGELFNTNGTWKDAGALKAAFEAAGVDPAEPIAATCGSGITAATVAFAAHILGNRSVAIYDGSWSEWGADASTQKAIGAA